MNKKKVLVGLSGGVDSAVSAHLLIKEGYEVIAGFMKNYVTDKPNCHTREDRDMAIKVAQHLGIKTFIIFDFREEYKTKIIDYIYESYKLGITPNPDVFCNNLIKFDLFLKNGLELGCSHIATGHYANTSQDSNGIYYLHRGRDENKDQSYFLSRLNQFQLSKSLFPIGGLQKSEVREIAHQINLPNADRKDSQGLCFIGNIGMAEFLKEKLEVKPGPIFNLEGKKIGTHEGAYFYTIGQRHGLGSLNKKMYVISTNIKENSITVDEKESNELMQNKIQVTNWERMSKEYKTPLECKGKIRYRQELQNCEIKTKNQEIDTNRQTNMEVSFNTPQRAVATGQIFCAYNEDIVVGSGIIT